MNKNLMNRTNSDRNSLEKILDNTPLVVVEFSISWCGSCHMTAGIIKKCADKYKDKVTMVRLEMEGNGHLAYAYDVYKHSTLLFFKQSVIVDSLIGFFDEGDLMTKLKTLVKETQ